MPECAPCKISFFHKWKKKFTWKGITLSIFYQEVFDIYIYIGAYLHYMHLICPFYAIYGTAGSVTLSGAILFTSVTQLAIWCLRLHRWLRSTKKELIQLQWFTHHNRNVEKRKKINVINQCYQELRGKAKLASDCLENITSNMMLLIPHRAATISWVKNLLMSLASP